MPLERSPREAVELQVDARWLRALSHAGFEPPVPRVETVRAAVRSRQLVHGAPLATAAMWRVDVNPATLVTPAVLWSSVTFVFERRSTGMSRAE